MRKSWYRSWNMNSWGAPHDTSIVWGGRLVSAFFGQVSRIRFWNRKPNNNWDRKNFWGK